MLEKIRGSALLKRIIERYALPLLLGTAVMRLIFNTYTVGNTSALVVFLYLLYEVALFALFEWLKPKKILRGFVYIFLLILSAFVGMQFLRSGWNATGASFIDWFYTDTADVGEVTQYFFFVFLTLGFFITSVLYYFTVYRFRSFGLMLVILFPFIIYGKRDEQLPQLSITLIMTVALALMVHERLVSDDVKDNTRFNRSYVIAIALFVSFSAAVAMLLPKPEITSELESNSSMFNVGLDNVSSTDYDNLSDESSALYGGTPTGEILFRMTTTQNEEVVYLRRQSFDDYDTDHWVFENSTDDFYIEDSDYMQNDNEINSPKYVYNLMKRLAQTGSYTDYGLTEDLFNDSQYTTVSNVTEYSNTFSPSYIIAPLMIDISPFSDYVTRELGDIRANVKFSGGLSANFSYTVEGEAEYAYAASLPWSQEEFNQLMSDAYLKGDITMAEYYNIQKINTHYTAYEGISDEIIQLAHDVTDGYDTDYEKAKAIVDYFETSGYSYDMYYDPDDKSLEYFLFDSKLGNCACYATSMTLMARIAGLPARYTEGFAAYEKDDDGAFVIRDYNAHAFVEVYVSGAGWVTFDPTVSGYMSSQGLQEESDGFFSRFIGYFSKIIIFIVVVFVLIFIVFLDRILEVVFRIRLKFMPPQLGTAALYTHIMKLLEISNGSRLGGYTPHQLEQYALEKNSADISKQTELFEKTCFGGYIPTEEEFKEAYEDYKAMRKALTARKKRQPVKL